jgi:hypothetical protein
MKIIPIAQLQWYNRWTFGTVVYLFCIIIAIIEMIRQIIELIYESEIWKILYCGFVGLIFGGEK